jgi:ribonuclease P protein component
LKINSIFIIYKKKKIPYKKTQYKLNKLNIVFSISKKKIKKAINRNKIKRKITIAYKKNILIKNIKTFNILYVYNGYDKHPKFNKIQNTINKSIKHIEEYSNHYCKLNYKLFD